MKHDYFLYNALQLFNKNELSGMITSSKIIHSRKEIGNSSMTPDSKTFQENCKQGGSIHMRFRKYIEMVPSP